MDLTSVDVSGLVCLSASPARVGDLQLWLLQHCRTHDEHSSDMCRHICQISALVTVCRNQLAEARQQLLREAEAREKLEENMKQAFMRGGCLVAMNQLALLITSGTLLSSQLLQHPRLDTKLCVCVQHLC